MPQRAIDPTLDSPDRDTALDHEMSAPDPVADYERVTRIIEAMSRTWRRQPAIDDIAADVGLSVTQVHHLLRRWAGLSPKAFLQALTLDAAKRMLRDNANLLDASLELGLSGPGRLHDLFVTHEAMSPGEWKAGGAGLALTYGFHASPFGEAILVATPRGLAGLGFVDGGDRAAALDDMRRRWPNATFTSDDPAIATLARRVFDEAHWQQDRPLRVVLIGTDFEVRVWETLLTIPMGRTRTYGSVAAGIGLPKAARAVGAAVGKNPISFVVPCHRVIGQSGALTGYHWGLTRKRAMLGWELAKTA